MKYNFLILLFSVLFFNTFSAYRHVDTLSSNSRDRYVDTLYSNSRDRRFFRRDGADRNIRTNNRTGLVETN